MSAYIDYVRDQLRALAGYSVRPMFGGHGLFWRGATFGFVTDEALYFRTDSRNRPDYEALGLTPFRPWADRKVVLKAYFPVPEETIEDSDTLVAWARKAIDAALAAEAAKKSKPAAKPRAKGKR